jgi:hypothetical protein
VRRGEHADAPRKTRAVSPLCSRTNCACSTLPRSKRRLSRDAFAGSAASSIAIVW